MSARDYLVLIAFMVAAVAWAGAWPEPVPGASPWRWESGAELVAAWILVWDAERQAAKAGSRG